MLFMFAADWVSRDDSVSVHSHHLPADAQRHLLAVSRRSVRGTTEGISRSRTICSNFEVKAVTTQLIIALVGSSKDKTAAGARVLEE